MPSLPQAFAQNGLLPPTVRARSERGMPERNCLDTFYNKLQRPSRTRVTTDLRKSEKKKEMRQTG